MREEDLTATARIRNAALAGFAHNGVAATSIRDVARAANVSPGLVQHHYKTKAALHSAVTDYVIEIINEAFADLEAFAETATLETLAMTIGNRIVELVRDHHSEVMYVINAAVRGEEAGLKIFDTFMALAKAQVERGAASGMLRDDADPLWVALHVVILNLGTVLFEPAINRHLDKPLRDPAQLERWNHASAQLFLRGLARR
jgi:AcrR family transcriptional regulator